MRFTLLANAMLCLAVLVSVAVRPMFRWEQLAWPLITLAWIVLALAWRKALMETRGWLREAEQRCSQAQQAMRDLRMFTRIVLNQDSDTGTLPGAEDPQV